MKLKTSLAFLAAIVFFASCVKNDSTANAGIAFQLKALVSPVQGAGIVWTIGTANVTEVKIEATKSDNTQIEFKSSADTFVNLFAPVTISTLNVPKGTYRQLEFRSELLGKNNHPSLRLEGSYTAGGVTTPIVFESADALEVKAKKDSIVIGEGATYAGVTTLSLAVLTAGITEADLKAANQPGGKIIISNNSNAALYAKMLLNLQNCGVIDFH
ncbi:MAG: hypothetical protein JO301_03750 [Chitinophagaceae bacterium]|nr:hypothetical protein [Chitinophagaceae bacterium]